MCGLTTALHADVRWHVWYGALYAFYGEATVSERVYNFKAVAIGSQKAATSKKHGLHRVQKAKDAGAEQ